MRNAMRQVIAFKGRCQREVYLSLSVLRGQIVYECQGNRMRACRAADVHDDDFRAGGRLASNAHTTRPCIALHRYWIGIG